MTLAARRAITERAWEVPSIRVGEPLPDPGEYSDYTGPGDNCSSRSYWESCTLTSGHPGNLHAAASLSGIITGVWVGDRGSTWWDG